MKKIATTFLLATLLGACQKDNPDKEMSVVQLTTQEEVQNRTELDRYILEKFNNAYNLQIVYRYSENDISRNFRYTVPPSTAKTLEAVNFLKYMYYDPYNRIAPSGFLQNYSPKQLILIGSHAYSDTGSRYNGAATNSVKIELTAINDRVFNTNSDAEIKDIDERVLRLIYHESSHLLEQTKVIPPAYERLSAADYKGSAWTTAWRGETYLKSGFISAYASDNIHEDFVEMIARYIIYYQKNQCGCPAADTAHDTNGDGLDDTTYNTWKRAILRKGYIWEEELTKADGKNNEAADYTGKEIILMKIEMVKNYLQREWNIDLDALRTEIHNRHANLPNKDFSQFEW